MDLGPLPGSSYEWRHLSPVPHHCLPVAPASLWQEESCRSMPCVLDASSLERHISLPSQLHVWPRDPSPLPGAGGNKGWGGDSDLSLLLPSVSHCPRGQVPTTLLACLPFPTIVRAPGMLGLGPRWGVPSCSSLLCMSCASAPTTSGWNQAPPQASTLGFRGCEIKGVVSAVIEASTHQLSPTDAGPLANHFLFFFPLNLFLLRGAGLISTR